MSNPKIDKLQKEFAEYGEVIDLIVSPPYTYTVVRVGNLIGHGTAKCMGADEFDARLGFTIALRRALKDIAAQQIEAPMLCDDAISCFVFKLSEMQEMFGIEMAE